MPVLPLAALYAAWTLPFAGARIHTAIVLVLATFGALWNDALRDDVLDNFGVVVLGVAGTSRVAEMRSSAPEPWSWGAAAHPSGERLDELLLRADVALDTAQTGDNPRAPRRSSPLCRAPRNRSVEA